MHYETPVAEMKLVELLLRLCESIIVFPVSKALSDRLYVAHCAIDHTCITCVLDSLPPRLGLPDNQSATCGREGAATGVTRSCGNLSRDPVYMSRKIRKFRTEKFDT